MNNKVFFGLPTNPFIHSMASGNDDVTAAQANALVNKYQALFSTEYERYQNHWRARLSVSLLKNHQLKGDRLKESAETFMADDIGMDPTHSAFALGKVFVGEDMYPIVNENGKPFSPRVFLLKTDKVGPDLDTRSVTRRASIGVDDYRRAVMRDGITVGHSSGGHFAQMINALGDKSPDGKRTGLVTGYRPHCRLDRADKVARITDKRDIARSFLLIIYGEDFDTLMNLVDLGGESVKALFYGEGAYFGAPEKVREINDISIETQREMVRSLTRSAPTTQSLGDKLQHVVIPSESAAATTEDEHVSDSDSEDVSSDGDETASSDEASATSTDEAPAVPFRTAAQQRAFDAAEKKRAQKAANDAASPVASDATASA